MIHTLFRDALLLMLVMLVVVVAFLLKYMADPTHVLKGDISAPGSLVVTVDWPSGIDDDVDTWLMAPGESSPVYYNHKAGVVWDLVRDDLGMKDDPTPANYEDAFTRGEPPGEYIVDVVCYRCRVAMPITVHVVVQEKNGTAELKTLSNTTIKLTYEHEEVTALDFVVGPDGTVDKSSLNTIYKSLLILQPE